MVFFIILILCLLANFFLPWWSIAIIAFLTSLCIAQTARQAFWSGFSAVFIGWIVLFLFKSVPNDHIMVQKMANLLHLPHWTLIFIISALLGSIVGGLASLSGLFTKLAFFSKHKSQGEKV